MIPTLTFERRQQIVDAVWGGLVVAWTVVVCALALSAVVALIAGYVAIGQWIGRQ